MVTDRSCIHRAALAALVLTLSAMVACHSDNGRGPPPADTSSSATKTCSKDIDCSQGQICSGSVCVVKPNTTPYADGHVCVNNADCASGSCNAQSVCAAKSITKPDAAPYADGHACLNNTECANDLCDPHTNLCANAATTVIKFPDAVLEGAIRTAINKPKGDIMAADVQKLGFLSFDGWKANPKISDISGLEYCTELTSLDLPYNSIVNLKPLSGLVKLLHLDLNWSDQLKDIAPLSGLTQLQYLIVSDGAGISDITPLARLTQLNLLYVNTDDKVVDLAPIAGLTQLTDFALVTNAQKYDVISQLKNLGTLLFYDDNISDINFLSGLTNLQSLRVGGKTDKGLELKSIQPLVDLKGLWFLELFNMHQVKSFNPIKQLSKLKHLGLYYANISDITFLSGLSSLISLAMNGNAIVDISALSALTNLSELDLRENNIFNITPLATLYANGGLHAQDSQVFLSENPLHNGGGWQINFAVITMLRDKGVSVDF